MHFNERHVGQFRIVAEANPAPRGGFTAGVTVAPLEAPLSDSVFADLALAEGFIFKEPSAAMKHAFDVGHRQVRMQSLRT